jgi:hypothetical protein
LVVVVLSSVLLAGTAWGQIQPPTTSTPQSNPEAAKCDPFLHALASFIIPGWGQWLNGERGKAVTHIVVGVVLTATPILLAGTSIALLTGLGRFVWAGYSGYDAFASCVAKYPPEQKGSP